MSASMKPTRNSGVPALTRAMPKMTTSSAGRSAQRRRNALSTTFTATTTTKNGKTVMTGMCDQVSSDEASPQMALGAQTDSTPTSASPMSSERHVRPRRHSGVPPAPEFGCPDPIRCAFPRRF